MNERAFAREVEVDRGESFCLIASDPLFLEFDCLLAADRNTALRHLEKDLLIGILVWEYKKR